MNRLAGSFHVRPKIFRACTENAPPLAIAYLLATQNDAFKTNCTTRYASPFETMAVEVDVLWVWQHAVPKFGDKMLVDPVLVDPNLRKFE